MCKNNASERISVIIPVYNTENWLRECVESVLSQTYQNLEILLIDDGSTDSSSILCDSYAQTYEQVKVYHQINQGLSAARNTGLDMATGSYIFFLDSDDFLETDALEIMYRTLMEQNADLVIGAYRRIRATGEELSIEGFPSSSQTTAISEKDFWQLSTRNTVAIVAWSKLYPRHLWDTLRFPIGKIHEDNAVLHYITEQCQNIVYLNQVIINYRSTPNSIINQPFRLSNLDKSDVLTDQILYLCEKGYTDIALYYFGVGSRLILRARNELDLSNAQTSDTIGKLYKTYKDLSQKLCHTLPPIGLKDRIRLFLFRLNLNLYQMVRDCFFKNGY